LGLDKKAILIGTAKATRIAWRANLACNELDWESRLKWSSLIGLNWSGKKSNGHQ
jgi:hypothetical protein